jgi:RND superfamily putative drug exporter
MFLSPRSLALMSATHPWRTLGVWAAALVVAFASISLFLNSALTTRQSFTNRPESKVGTDLLEQRLRGPEKDNEVIVVTSTDLTVDSQAFRSQVEDISSRVSALGPEIVTGETDFYQSGDASLVSADRHTTIIPVTMSGSLDDANDNVAKVLDIVEGSNNGSFQVFAAGTASIGHEFQKAAERDLGGAEKLGVPIALVILIAVFGAVAAAFIPIVLALVAIAVAVGITAVIGQASPFSFFVTNMISMMGLAVGIDYTLFIVSRYREEREKGLEKVEAITSAGAHAGRTVLFSGFTVVLALLGMLIIPTTIFRSLAGGAVLVVLASVAASLTLLPAVLSIAGDRVNALTIPLVGKVQHTFDEGRHGGFWDRLSRTVMKHPVVSVVVAGGILLAASIPYFDLNVSVAGVSTLPDSFQSKKAFQILERDFGGGRVYTADVVIDGPVRSSSVQAGVDKLKALAAADPAFGPSTFEANPAGELGLLSISIALDPNSKQAMDAVRHLRSALVPQAFGGAQAKVYVTGFTAQNVDFFALTDRYTPIVFGFVLGLSFILLMVVFRSIVVPAKAVLLNLLSVGAAYGLLVLVSQKGFAAGILGLQQVEGIEPWLPLFLFSVLFGLSMDYHVFLLSRIREKYDSSGDNTEAISFGVRSTGRLITGAALIMVAVFAGFASGQMVDFQQVGFGLGVAVLIDATIIRSILVPASMKLLGRANWYLPPVLSWLPHVGIEADEPQSRRWEQHPEPTAGGG